MSIPYLARRRIKSLFLTILVLIILAALVCVAAVTYMKRYVVYTRDNGVVLDFNVDTSNSTLNAVVAAPPAEDETVPIFYNEGENAIAMNKDLTQVWGYYITTDDLARDLNGCRERVALLEAGTAVMIELKNGFGTFNYSTKLAGAPLSANVDVQAVDAFIQELRSRNLYLIARISAFRDRSYGMEHVTRGIYHVNKLGLWPDSQHCYWLDPTKDKPLSYLISITKELRNLGFDEVVFSEFRIPDTDRIVLSGNRSEIIKNTASDEGNQ